MPNFHICKVINDTAYNFQDTTGHVRWTDLADIHILMLQNTFVVCYWILKHLEEHVSI